MKLLTLGTLLCPLIASAIAAHQPHTGDRVERAGVRKLERAHQFAAAAYCDENNGRTAAPSRLLCPGSIEACKDFRENKISIILKFHDIGPSGGTGYIAVDTHRKKIVIAFRGSASLQNDLADARFPLWSVDKLCKECSVVQGFWESWASVKHTIIANIERHRKRNPTYTDIEVIGHSLGGAVATVAALDLRNQGLYVDLFTFGAPRVGNARFAMEAGKADQAIGMNHRVTHLNDWVSKVPPLGYAYHIDNEFFIRSKNKWQVVDGEIEFLKGKEYKGNVTGNAAMKSVDPTFDTHAWFFDHITECSPGLIDATKFKENWSNMRPTYVPNA